MRMCKVVKSAKQRGVGNPLRRYRDCDLPSGHVIASGLEVYNCTEVQCHNCQRVSEYGYKVLPMPIQYASIDGPQC